MIRGRKRRTPNEVPSVMVLPVHGYHYVYSSGFCTLYLNLVQQPGINSTLQNLHPLHSVI